MGYHVVYDLPKQANGRPSGKPSFPSMMEYADLRESVLAAGPGFDNSPLVRQSTKMSTISQLANQATSMSGIYDVGQSKFRRAKTVNPLQQLEDFPDSYWSCKNDKFPALLEATCCPCITIARIQGHVYGIGPLGTKNDAQMDSAFIGSVCTCALPGLGGAYHATMVDSLRRMYGMPELSWKDACCHLLCNPCALARAGQFVVSM